MTFTRFLTDRALPLNNQLLSKEIRQAIRFSMTDYASDDSSAAGDGYEGQRRRGPRRRPDQLESFTLEPQPSVAQFNTWKNHVTKTVMVAWFDME